MPRPDLICHFSPMPPARNGIADYAFQVVDALSKSYKSMVFCEDAFAEAPDGVVAADWLQAFRFVRDGTCFIHQIGNNWDHTFVVRAAHMYPGIIVLHDINLLYLYESLELSNSALLGDLIRSNPTLARARARDIVIENRKMRADYSLFTMLAEVTHNARAIVVHSNFAKSVLLRHLGKEADGKVHVVPHFAYDPPTETRDEARARLGLEDDWFVVLTSGFATRVKRYDWLIEALDKVASKRRNVVWVQAGPVRAEEFDLEALISQYPNVRSMVRLAGYVSEADLQGYVAAADVVVNTRFPSVGESSGILARALPAGACCIVSDTAGYRELPADAVIKVPAAGAADTIADVLLELIDSPMIREKLGAAARRYAFEELSMEKYVERLDTVITGSSIHRQETPAWSSREIAPATRLVLSMDAVRSGRVVLGEAGSRIELSVGPIAEDLIEFDLMSTVVPSNILVEAVELVLKPASAQTPPAKAEVFLDIRGHVVG